MNREADRTSAVTAPMLDVAARYAVFASLVIYALVAVNVAWFSDDAMISARTSWNLADGEGLVFNLGERVQSFTNPL